jgi:hypothetical protein
MENYGPFFDWLIHNTTHTHSLYGVKNKNNNIEVYESFDVWILKR